MKGTKVLTLSAVWRTFTGYPYACTSSWVYRTHVHKRRRKTCMRYRYAASYSSLSKTVNTASYVGCQCFWQTRNTRNTHSPFVLLPLFLPYSKWAGIQRACMFSWSKMADYGKPYNAGSGVSPQRSSFREIPTIFLTFLARWVRDTDFRTKRRSRGEMWLNGQTDRQTDTQTHRPNYRETMKAKRM